MYVFYVLLAVHPCIILLKKNQLGAQLFFLTCLLFFSTCFGQLCAHPDNGHTAARTLVEKSNKHVKKKIVHQVGSIYKNVRISQQCGAFA